MSKVFYLGFYGDSIAYKQNRNIVPAGVNKMDYIARAMGEAELDVTIISPAWANYNKSSGVKIFKQRKFKINENVKAIMPFSIALPLRVTKILTISISKFWLIIYFLLKIRSEDKVVVYHSPFYFTTMYWLKKIIKFTLILEVEEIYSIVFSLSKRIHGKEMRLIRIADNYIFPNDLMCDYLKITDKKHLIVYGTYHIPKTRDMSINFNDGKIHVVYAGIIDKLKNGAFNAIKIAKFLPENYKIHILGFGQEKDLINLTDEINIINTESKCKVIYEGKKTGDEYLNFISSCEIGLSTQKNEGEYLKFTFPSKVLSYLSLGLNVVSARMDCLTKSAVDPLIHYYEVDSYGAIAKTIISIRDFDRKERIQSVNELNIKFINDLRNLLKNDQQ